MSARARRTEVQAAIQGMEQAHLKCRDYGHSWEPYTVNQEGRVWRRVLRCSRCETLRRQVYRDGSGDMMGNTYSHAEGYRINGLGHLSGTDRGLIRLASTMVDKSKLA